MAWPGNFNNGPNAFWEAIMSGPGGPSRGAGVDRAAPQADMFGNPDHWNPWAGRGGWGGDEFFGPGPGPRHHGGRHGRHGHGHGHEHGGSFEGRRGGGRRHHHRGPSDDNDNENAAPPEYSDDDGAAGEKSGNEKDDSPDTMMREDTADAADAADPHEEVPSDGEGSRHRHGGRHGKRHGGPCGAGKFGHHGPPHRGPGHHGPGGFGPRGGPHHGPGHHGPGHHGPGGFGSRGGPHHGPGHHGPGHHGPGHHGPGPRGGPHHGPPGPPPFPFGLFGGMGGPHHGHGHRGPRGHHGPPPPPTGYPPLDAILGGLAGHPLAQQARDFMERMQQGNTPDAARDANNNNNNNESSSDEEEADTGATFQPPVDVFGQPSQWVVHIAVPGAKKEDVGVNWDADRSVLSISGVIHRPGDEAFLSSIVASERAVGLFSRDVRLPPVDAQVNENGRDEVDPDGIVAKMEDGVLIVTVPKVEKGWTEVRKVGIE